MMLRLFYPDGYADSVRAIDYDRLYEMGYRGLIFDIDNTLVPHGEPATPEVEAFFALLQKKGFKTLVLSDNSEERVLSFLTNIDALHINSAKKPRPGAFRRAVRLLGMSKDRVVYIGDQVFTDILGANLAGLDCILVKYIGHELPGYKGKRRAAEAAILARYQKSRRYDRLRLSGDQR